MRAISIIVCTLSFLAPLTAQPKPVPDQAELEARFKKLLAGSKMVGSFTVDGQESKAPQRETYTISKVKKVKDDRWRITAKIEYAGKSVTQPVAVRVKWAGDTPMIQVSDLTVPGLGTYSARVLFHGERYAGTWSGKSYGGHMFGQVVREDAAKPATDPEKDGEQASAAWPSYRGRFGRGVAHGHETAVKWDVEKGENVKWKTAVPGLSHSSPVVWGDRLFITTSVPQKKAELRVGLYGDIKPVENEGPQEFRVLCLDKNTGKILWSRTAWKGTPKIKRHPKGTHAASTPATDGQRVVAFFGTEGLYAYDMEGNPLWKREFGVLDSGFFRVKTAQWGFASSPVIHKDRVYIQCDVQEGSFVAALDATTGQDVWRTPRKEVPGWGTPTVHIGSKRRQLILNGWKHIGGYDLDNGKELWWLEGGGDIPVPTPIVSHDLAFITSAHGRFAPILAISLDAEGELEMNAENCDDMVWSKLRRGNYMQTPIIVGDELYCCRDNGSLRCYDAKTGAEHYNQRLGEGMTGFTSSAVAADDKIYFTSEIGDVYVVQAGKEFKLLAENSLHETCLSTPAISAGTIFFHTRGHVVAIAPK